VKKKWNSWLPVALMSVFAITRCPGALPHNFSAAYALAFCAGVYFSRKLAWWLPLTTLLLTDVGINLYYLLALDVDAFQVIQLVNYGAFAILIWLGAKFNPRTSFWKLLSGGLIGAVLFYLITNTASWFFNPFHNPEYTKTINGWILALTKGTAGYPETWQFFRNTIFSGGLFTGLFVGAMKLGEQLQTSDEVQARDDSEGEAEASSPEQSKA
jgi:hypothetical protein